MMEWYTDLGADVEATALFVPFIQGYVEDLIQVERNTSAGLYTPERS